MPEYAGWCDNNKPGFRSYEVCTRGICELANYSAYGAGGGRNLSNASTLRELGLYCQDDDAAVARPSPVVPVGTLLYGEKGY